MAATNQWLVPKLEGRPHLTKPPMAYWAYAASITGFGESEAALRLPCVVAFAFSVLFTALIAAQLTGNHKIGITAGLLQIVSPLALASSHVGTTDVFLAALEPAYMLAFLLAHNANTHRRSARLSFIAFTICALAFLTKGPPALLPLLSLIVYLLLCRKTSRWYWGINPWGAAWSLALSASWYLVVLLKLPQAREVWVTEALHKVFVDSERNMPRIYYVFILLIGCLPAFIAIGMYGISRLKEPRSLHPKILPAVYSHDATLFSLLWLVFPFCIFIAVKTRLPLYVLPLSTPVNVLGATALIAVLHHTSKPQAARIIKCFGVLGLAIAILFVVLKIHLGRHPEEAKDMKPLANAIRVDAARLGKQPRIFFTMTRMGNGVLFYLQSPPSDRLIREKDLSQNSPQIRTAHILGGHDRSFRTQAFASEIPTTSALYIIMDAGRESRYATSVPGLYVPVYANSHWVVWRRTGHYLIEPDTASTVPVASNLAGSSV